MIPFIKVTPPFWTTFLSGHVCNNPAFSESHRICPVMCDLCKEDCSAGGRYIQTPATEVKDGEGSVHSIQIFNRRNILHHRQNEPVYY